MKEKLNNALGCLDERLIQEAAEAERLESNAPKIMRRILIPTGTVAAAGLCVFALANRPDGGVDLTENMAASSAPASVVSEKKEIMEILPEIIPLDAQSRESAENTVFGSESELFPVLIYADDNRIAFTDWSSIYLYNRNEGRITYSANIYEALEEYAGDKLEEFGEPVWFACEAAVNGDELMITVSVHHDPTDAYYNYKIDPEAGLMRRYDALDEGYTKYEQNRPANNSLGADVVDVVRVSDSEYVALGLRGSFDLRGVEIREYEVSDGNIQVTNTAKPFDDEYFNSLESVSDISEDEQQSTIYDENNSWLTQLIQERQEQDSIDKEKISKLVAGMTYPLDSKFTDITVYNGYDAWIGGYHYGIDIGSEGMGGASVYAPLSGTVIEANGDNDMSSSMGNYIIIDHGSGLATVYAHLREVNVTTGQTVSQGDVIGTVGNSGWSTGNHLHFEIRSGGEIDNGAMDLFTGKVMLSLFSEEETPSTTEE